MADTVTSKVRETADRYTVHLTCVSDGTGETNVLKVDKSAILDASGEEPPLLRIASVRWAIQGFTRIKLSTDHNTDDTTLVLNGNGYANWEHLGGLFDANSAGGTGDLLLTSTGTTSGSSYDIDVEVLK